VDTGITCRGHSHRLHWENGQLTTPDHTDTGVGAGPSEECGRVCRAWGAFRGDPRVLVVGRRHPGDIISRMAALRSGDPLAQLLGTLDPALERRLQLEVAHTMAATYTPGTSEATILEAATVGRATRALERWLGPGRPYSVTLSTAPAVSEDGVAALAPTWLSQVWARYLSVVDGFLVLEVTRIVEDRAEVIGVGRPGGDPALLTLRGPAPWRAISRQPLSGPRSAGG
jgi:hypothetical protein